MNDLVLCDTNIFIEILKKNETIRSELYIIGVDDTLTCDTVNAELIFGAKDKQELFGIKNFLNNYSSLSIQPEISKKAINLMENYSLSHKLSFPDALIAATALHHNVELFTLNTKDFRFIPNLKLYQI
ncbi:MAG: type II toxin-antitoxin system VapC family toxin [Bacteroidetes bacterium]|nr:type II toxin-antitoxin system VapC family toxin [Bacteroidota bacterium]